MMTPSMKKFFKDSHKKSLTFMLLASFCFSGLGQDIDPDTMARLTMDVALSQEIRLKYDHLIPNSPINSGQVMREIMSGDTVGNGFVIETDDYTIDGGNFFLSPEEREKRNDIFNEILENDLGDFWNDTTRSMSGDTVGNGGGLLESQAYFYYHNLVKHIISSFEQHFIEFNLTEKKVLLAILDILKKEDRNGKILFLSEFRYPNFFHTLGFDPAPRIAKTGFSPEFPIFVNLDAIYRSNSNPRFWIGVLIHELGHQAGVAHHGFLDELGSKVMNVSEMNKSEIEMVIKENQVVELGYYNHDFIDGLPDLYVSYEQKLHSIDIGESQIFNNICGEGLNFGGVSLSNLHWKDRGVFDVADTMKITAKGWASVKCLDEEAGIFYDKNLDIQVEISIADELVNSRIQLK
ncbi:MAG: hypothetical protein K9K67_09605 [Bacteriovoracaceae bacterium]|nr:hypothetical protein [Bacteriovoracaceae bacterium]